MTVFCLQNEVQWKHEVAENRNTHLTVVIIVFMLPFYSSIDVYMQKLKSECL